MNTQKQQQIERQINAILANFGPLNVEASTFWRIARREECNLKRTAERFANGEISEDKMNEIQAIAINRVLRCFESPYRLENVMFVNSDPRGYSLKVDFEGVKKSGLYTDFGGFGILAPEY